MFTKTKTINKFAATLAALMLLIFAVLPLSGCEPVGGSNGGDDPDPGATYYTVTFETDGGSTVKPQTVKASGKVQKPANPTKSGYDFGGWYKEETHDTPWSFEFDTVEKDTTLYAKWTKKVVQGGDGGDGGNGGDGGDGGDGGKGDEVDPQSGVTATFNVGRDARLAGVSNPAAQVVESGSKIKQPTVTLSGCTVDGWYAENGKEKWDFDSDLLTTNTTFFAKWSGTIPGITPGTPGAPEFEPDDYTPTMSNSGSLYIHYLRSDGNYENWHIWAWNGSNNGQWFERTTIDKSGAVFEVSLAQAGATNNIMFIVALGSWQTKDGEADNSLSLSAAQKVGDSYHWYVQSGYVASGTPYLAKLVEGSPIGGGTVVDRSFAQNLSVMKTAENTDDMGVGYQIFVASFCDSDGDGMGDIRGIINKLDYLDALNVDVLWLTPIQSSNSYHGYDCYDYYAIDPKFGTNADYRELVYKAHKLGMKVIMDLVVNHTSPQNEWFLKSVKGVKETVTYQDGTKKTVDYTSYYRWSDTKKSGRYYGAENGKYFYSSFGSNMPELNYDYQEARDAMADVAMYWLAYGLDGFRMDAIKHMFMWDESDHTGDVEGRPQEAASGYNFNLSKDVEWFKEFNYRLKTKYPYCFLLGENLTGDVDYVAPFYAGMDSLFDFNTYYDLPGRIKSGDVSATAGALNENAQSYEKARDGSGRAINSMITSNHDIPRLAAYFNRNTAYQKAYFAVIMTMPGLSWIYYGDEIGMYSEITQGDNDDRRARQPMKWTSAWANKALPSDVPNNHYDDNLSSAEDQAKDSGSLLSYVRSLTKLRNDYPALIHGTAVCGTQDGMLKITVTDGDEIITVFHNFTSGTKTASASGKIIFGSATVAAYGTVAYSNK